MTSIDRTRLLEPGEVAAAVATLDGWTIDGDRLARSLAFADFVRAFGFMTSVALVAEQLGHHPEWSNVYGRVDVAITNHDAGGLTELDVEFCRRVDSIARGGTHV